MHRVLHPHFQFVGSPDFINSEYLKYKELCKQYPEKSILWNWCNDLKEYYYNLKIRTSILLAA